MVFLAFTYEYYFDMLGEMKRRLALTSSILIWLAISFALVFITSGLSFSVLSRNYSSEIFNLAGNQPLLKGEKLVAKVRALDNYLGIVGIRFNTFDKSIKDRVEFILKVEGNETNYFQTTINTDQFVSHKLFPFGFPIIDESQNKVFQIEIRSHGGSRNQAIALSEQKPVLVLYHQYPSSELKTNPVKLFTFMAKKLVFSFQETRTLGISLLAAIPFLIILFWNRFKILFSKSLVLYRPVFFLASFSYLTHSVLERLLKINWEWLFFCTQALLIVAGLQVIYLCLRSVFYEK